MGIHYLGSKWGSVVGKLKDLDFATINDPRLEAFYVLVRKVSFKGEFHFHHVVRKATIGFAGCKALMEQLISEGLVIKVSGDYHCDHLVGENLENPAEQWDLLGYEDWVKDNSFVKEDIHFMRYQHCPLCKESIVETLKEVEAKYNYRPLERKVS